MSSLANQTCESCELGAPLVPEADQVKLLKALDGWEIDNTATSKLVCKYKFPSYKEASTFANLIVNLAESVGNAGEKHVSGVHTLYNPAETTFRKNKKSI